MVHRDISPPNVLLTRHGEIKVVDFGLAKANSQLEQSEPGIIKGKFSYLSPEAALGESVDLRADIFAVGIILWELVANRRLFLADSDLATVRLVQAAKVPDIRQFNPDVSDELNEIIKRVLARDPRERYQSARELGEDLTKILFAIGEPVSAFDIGRLVEEVAEDHRRKRADQKASIIGSLIEDAMMEFTSLEPDKGVNLRTLHSTTTSLASQPLEAFEDVRDWSSDLGMELPAATSDGSGYSAGNLAALEDDAPGSSLPPAVGSATSVRPPSVSARPPPVSAHSPKPPLVTSSPPSAAPHATAKKPGSGVVAVVVVLVAAAGAAGAYLSGMIQ